MLEKETQRAILEYLQYRGILAWRNNSGMFKTEGGGFYRAGVVGGPDIIAILPPSGRFWGCEVKSSTGRLNPAQRLFKSQIEKAGGLYTVARSVDDVVEALSPPLLKSVPKGK